MTVYGCTRTPQQAELLQGSGLPEELGMSYLVRHASRGWREGCFGGCYRMNSSADHISDRQPLEPFNSGL